MFGISYFEYEYIILIFGYCFLFKKIKKTLTFLIYTCHIIKKNNFNIYKYTTVFIFIENENAKNLYLFFVFKSNF